MKSMRAAAAAVLAALAVTTTPCLAGWDEGVAAFAAKNYRQAIVEFKQVVRRAPTNWEARVYLGRAYAELGDFRRAEKALIAAQRIAPPADKAAAKRIWKQLGYTYEKQKKYVKSREAYLSAGEREHAARVDGLRDARHESKKKE